MAAAGGLWRGPGGVAVNPPALNLLRYPRRGPLEPQEWRPTLLALVAGAAVGALWVLWQHWRLDQLQVQRGQLQTQAHTVAAERAADAARHAQALRQQALHLRAQDWRTQQALGLRLQATLGTQGQTLGLRVLRWHGDGRQMQLQAWLPRVQQVPVLVSALSAVGLGQWTVQSLDTPVAAAPQGRERAAEHEGTAGLDAVGGGVLVLLQASWPQAAPEKKQATP